MPDCSNNLVDTEVSFKELRRKIVITSTLLIVLFISNQSPIADDLKEGVFELINIPMSYLKFINLEVAIGILAVILCYQLVIYILRVAHFFLSKGYDKCQTHNNSLQSKMNKIRKLYSSTSDPKSFSIYRNEVGDSSYYEGSQTDYYTSKDKWYKKLRLIQYLFKTIGLLLFLLTKSIMGILYLSIWNIPLLLGAYALFVSYPFINKLSSLLPSVPFL